MVILFLYLCQNFEVTQLEATTLITYINVV